jgi:hypothetical protein
MLQTYRVGGSPEGSVYWLRRLDVRLGVRVDGEAVKATAASGVATWKVKLSSRYSRTT